MLINKEMLIEELERHKPDIFHQSYNLAIEIVKKFEGTEEIVVEMPDDTESRYDG